MPLLWVILTVMIAATGLLADGERLSSNRAAAVDVDALAHNLLIYRNALAEYAYYNPGVSGVPADSTLNLPTWWVHTAGVRGYVQAGSSYAYYAAPPNGLVTTLAQLTESAAVGYATNGQLVSPSAGATGVTLPAAVPAGAAVAYR